MTDVAASSTPASLLDRLLFVQHFDRLLNTDASPEACAENLKQIAFDGTTSMTNTFRTVDIYPANAETYHFEIRHRVRQRRRPPYTLIKADGTLLKDPETSRTRVTGSLSIDPTNIGTFAIVFILVVIALIEPFFRLMFVVGIGFCIYQAYVIRSAYLDVRARLFAALEAS